MSGPCNTREAVCWCCDKTEAEAKAHVAAGGQGCAAACHENDADPSIFLRAKDVNAIRANVWANGATRPTPDDVEEARANRAQLQREFNDKRGAL